MGNISSNAKGVNSINCSNRDSFGCEYTGDSHATIGLPFKKVESVQSTKFIYYNIPPDELNRNVFNIKLKLCNYLNHEKDDECIINLKAMKAVKNIINNIEYFDIKKNTEKGQFIYRYQYKKSNGRSDLKMDVIKTAQIIYTHRI